MKIALKLLLVVVLASAAVSAQAVSKKDVKVLEGGTWVGTLVYLDYGSGKKTSIKSNLKVTKKSDDVWTFEYVYPDEPKANGSSDVAISGDGKTFNAQTVTSKRRSNGVLEVVTTKDGEDNGKKAVFRYTYSIGKKNFSIRKDVQYVGQTEWFERNTYSWTR